MSRTPAKRSNSRSLADLAPDEVKSVVDQYSGIYDAGLESRKERYQSLVNHYYDLVTDFYEFGWGQSFHFAPRRQGESFKASLLRHQHFLADRLSLKPGMQVLDVGCGVGGPMGNLARYSGAGFVGINNNAYQIERAKLHTRDVESLCRFIHGDYMQIPEDDDRFDAAFAIESHAPRTGQDGGVPGDSSGSCVRGPVSRATSGVSPRLSIRETPSTSGSRTISWWGTRYRISPSHRRFAPHCAGPDSTFWKLSDRASESDPETPWHRALQGSRPHSFKHSAHTCRAVALTNLTLQGFGAVTGGPERHPCGQHAVECDGGRAGRRRQVRYLYADVFLSGPQTRGSGD